MSRPDAPRIILIDDLGSDIVDPYLAAPDADSLPTIDWCVTHSLTNRECCAESGHREPPWRYLAACEILRVPLPVHLGAKVDVKTGALA